MNYLSVEQVSKSFGINVLFEDLSFGVNRGQKIALIAENGSGKTTLVRCLTGKDTFDSGEARFRKDIKVSYLDQDQEFPEDQSIMEVVLSGEGKKVQALKAYHQALLDGSENLQSLLEAMDEHGAWQLESQIEEVLSKLKLDDQNQVVGTMSGGQVKRLALARVLLEEPDFVVLDEPTNHLDLDMIEWLEDYLGRQNLTILMITHDRYFLETVCDEILELYAGELHRYKGNYSYYLEKKAEREELERINKGKAQNKMKKELEWLRRQPKARGTKSKSRISAFDGIKKAATKKIGREEMELQVKMERLGTKIIEMHKIRKSYSDKVMLDGFDYVFKRRERLGIVGKNGTGKTTFLNIISGKEEFEGGKLVIGDTIKIGYYSQKGLKIDDDKRVIEVVREFGDFVPLAKGRKLSASQLLERFLFNKDKQYQYVSTLSGGEKKRLYLLTVLIENPNFLILDEPTNDLDIYTLNVLEEYLKEFEGCLVVVTHDRYFMDKLTDHLFVFQGNGKIKDFNGNYSDYVLDQKRNKQDKAETVQSGAEEVKQERVQNRSQKKLSYMEQREYEELESEIETLEKRKAELDELLAKPDEAGDEINTLIEEYSTVNERLETCSERWLELAEKLE